MPLNNPEKLDLSAFSKAILSLQDSLEVIDNTTWFNNQSLKVQNTLLAGAIQNFEFVYELSIKMIRRQLELEADSPNQIDETNFRDLLRIAAEKGLIPTPETWFKYRQMRNITAHTYDHDKAYQIYCDTQVFILEAKQLLIALEKRHA